MFSSREAVQKTLVLAPSRQAKCFVLYLRQPDLRANRWNKLQVVIVASNLSSLYLCTDLQNVFAVYDDIGLALH